MFNQKIQKKITREMKRRKQYFVTFGFKYDNVKRRERREFYDGSRKSESHGSEFVYLENKTGCQSPDGSTSRKSCDEFTVPVVDIEKP